jgi:hypothetical protein
MNIINKEFSQTEYDVMTPTSRCGNINRTFKVEEKSENGLYLCRIIKSDAWYHPGSTYRGEALYENNDFRSYSEEEILTILKQQL